jgi:hypothetical protein
MGFDLSPHHPNQSWTPGSLWTENPSEHFRCAGGNSAVVIAVNTKPVVAVVEEGRKVSRRESFLLETIRSELLVHK